MEENISIKGFGIKFLFIILLCFGTLINANSQDLPYELPRDTVEVEPQLEVEPDGYMTTLEREQFYSHSPRRASLYSAVLPGLGQAYNGKYWKIPILYVGSGVLVYFIRWNNQSYVNYKSALFTHLSQEGREGWVEGRVFIPSLQDTRDEAAVRRLVDQRRRDRDFLIIMSGLVYMLNIADAMVDAHLQSFDLGDDLSLKIKPAGGITDNAVRYAGLSLTLKF